MLTKSNKKTIKIIIYIFFIFILFIVTYIEVILNQVLGKAFRRDDIKKPAKEAGINKIIIKRQFF